MEQESERLGVEWLVACLAPGDIAPHPNFRVNEAVGAELLALIVKYQWPEYSAYRSAIDEDQLSRADGVAIPDAAMLCLDSDTMQEGLDQLLQLAGNAKLSIGQRAASALLAATTFSRLDRPDESIEVLSHVIDRASDSSARAGKSRDLVITSLLQQCAFRAIEAGQLVRARAYAERARDIINTLTGSNDTWEEFSVSRGIGWSASESQERLADAISWNIRAMLVTTGDPLDQSWADLVRTPFPVAAIRPSTDALSAVTTSIDDLFKKTYASRRIIRKFGPGLTDIRLLYASLLQTELMGDLGVTARTRQLLANVLSVRYVHTPEHDDYWHSEALRLYRQSDSEEHLRRVLEDFNRRGALSLLGLAAENLISVRSSQEYITSVDLDLIRYAADLLDAENTERALKIAFRYPGQDGRNGRVKLTHVITAKQLETALGVVAALVDGNEEIDMTIVAESAIDLVQGIGSNVDEFIASALAELAAAIDWEEVSASVKERWLLKIESLAREAQSTRIDRLRIIRSLGENPSVDMKDDLSNLEFVAAILYGFFGTASTEDLDKAVRIVSGTLSSAQEDAGQGRIVGYRWSPFWMAGILVRQYGRSDLWPILLSALTDSNVARESKAEALKMLTRVGAKIALPDAVRDELRRQPIAQTGGVEGLFSSVSDAEFGAVCRNFYLAHDLYLATDIERLADSIIEDSSSKDAAVRRVAATGCLIYAIKRSKEEWAQVLLAQLSHDAVSTVKETAATHLAYLSISHRISMKRIIGTRVADLMLESGSAIAMSVLSGLGDAVEHGENAERDSRLSVEVKRLMDKHESRRVRRTAKELLQRWR